MKIRTGFVSNSSSSSFIIGYGSVTNRQKFESYCNKYEIEFSLIDKTGKLYSHDGVELIDADWLDPDDRIITAGNETEIIIPKDFSDFDNGLILRVEITNDEGDGEFYSQYDDYRYHGPDYEKAKHKEFYSEKQQKIIELFDQDFIKNSKYIIGAERNG
jgi:hypothetical protein